MRERKQILRTGPVAEKQVRPLLMLELVQPFPFMMRQHHDWVHVCNINLTETFWKSRTGVTFPPLPHTFPCGSSTLWCLLGNWWTQPRKWQAQRRLSWWSRGLRIHLAMQGMPVRSLVPEDPTCPRAAKSGRHNYWAHMPPFLQPVRLEPVIYKGNHQMRNPSTTTRQ